MLSFGAFVHCVVADEVIKPYMCELINSFFYTLIIMSSQIYYCCLSATHNGLVKVKRKLLCCTDRVVADGNLIRLRNFGDISRVTCTCDIQ